jgi:hypothetical protein
VKQGGVAVRSYRLVVDQVERRIYRVDRWRLPSAHGVSIRAILYALAALATIWGASRLPVVGWALGALPASLSFGALPILAAWLLASWRVDGRAPHHALSGVLRYTASPRTVAGLRRCPAVGSRATPVDAVEIAPAGDEHRYRAGRLCGPAIVALRYPARIELEGVSWGADSDRGERIASAKRLVVTPMGAGARPLSRARTLRVPAGKGVVFR